MLFIYKVWRVIGKRHFWKKSFTTTITVSTISTFVNIAYYITKKDNHVVQLRTYTKHNIDTFKNALPTNYSCIVAVCDHLVENRLNLASIGEINIAHDSVWTTDLLTNRLYPRTLAVDFHKEFTPNDGDPRLLWELNRLQFLITLAQGYVLTKRDAYLRTATRIIDSWTADNTFCCGVNWADTQEVGIRMTSLILAKFLFEAAGSPIDSKISIQQLITEHSDYVLFNLSLGRATHNHLLTELASLLIYLLTTSADDPLSNLKRVFSIRMLQNEINKQLDADGISREQSTNYTFFVYDAIILANYFYYTSYNRNLVDQSTLSRMIRVIDSFSVGKNDFVKIGDADCGCHSKLSWNSDLSRSGYIAVIKNLFLNQDKNITNCSEELFWLQPDACRTDSNKNSNQSSSREPYLFKDSGFMSFCTNNRKLFLRLGPTSIDPDVRFGHAHSDYLSFSMYINETPVFIDPGTKTYLGPDSKRAELRSAMNHNTATLDKDEFLDVNTYTFGIPELLPVSISELAEHGDYYSIEASFKYKKKGVISRIFIFDNKLDTITIINTAQSTIATALTERYAITQDASQQNVYGYAIELPGNITCTINFLTDNENLSSVYNSDMEYAARYALMTNGTTLNRETTLSNGLATTYTIIRLTNNAPQPDSILQTIRELAVNDFT